MAKESGINVILKVGDGGGPEAFTTLAGQQSTTFGGSSETDDITDKGNSGWTSRMQVLRTGTVQASGKADWPDTTGLAALQTAWRTGASINCEVHLNAAGDKYSGSFSVTNFEISGEHNAATSYSITLEPTASLTYAAGS